MKLILSGEDGYTFYALTNEIILKDIMNDLGLESIDKIWFRPSFGRGAGARKIDSEKGYSGFGESDALIVGMDKANCRNFVFVESKKGNCDKGAVNRKQLAYQFFLKFSLVNAIFFKARERKFGQDNKSGLYYIVDIHEMNSMKGSIASILLQYYNDYKSSGKSVSQTRKNGWLLKMGSKDSPSLDYLEKGISENKATVKFKFLALGFQKQSDSNGKMVFFKDLKFEPDKDICTMFSFHNGLDVSYRNVKIKSLLEVPIPIDYQEQLRDVHG